MPMEGVTVKGDNPAAIWPPPSETGSNLRREALNVDQWMHDWAEAQTLICQKKETYVPRLLCL